MQNQTDKFSTLCLNTCMHKSYVHLDDDHQTLLFLKIHVHVLRICLKQLIASEFMCSEMCYLI